MPRTDDAHGDFRLPNEVVPRRYDLRLAPDLDAAAFTGEERLEIEVLEPVDAIVLHAVDLALGSASLSPGWASEGIPGPSAALETHLVPELDQVRLVPPARIEVGRYTVSISFTGVLNDLLCGFYRSTFVDDDGVERVIATTQFEDTDARRAFPCFDEPDKKAVFAVTLDVDESLFCVSNGAIVSEEDLGGGRKRVAFADTMVMSSYLVCFVVGPLEATAPILAEGVEVRVVHVPGKGGLTRPALDSAAHALGYYRDYFGIPYPADKLDLVALPDFAAGAMENVGCVTFRDAILLADPDSTSRAELQRLAEVVEHELAHMWFGDLVTMRWWNGLWLNEAFATFMALKCQDDYRPEWQCFVGFSRDKAGALLVDGLHSTRPVEFPVRHPSEAAAMFDVLTYEKGASVLWMLERFVGEQVFRDGVRRYLADHLYANTETTDLWDAIEAEAGSAIRSTMDTWIFQGGYPLVEVALGEGGLECSQRPFTYLPEPPGATSAVGAGWLVPLVVRSADGEERHLLGATPERLSGSGTVVVNAGGAGFYRTSYAAELLEGLFANLELLGPSERYNLLSDLWATTLAGVRPLADFLGAIAHLGEESDPDVWSVVVGAFGFLDRVSGRGELDAVRELARSVLRPQLDRVGWTPVAGESEQVPLLRSSLISALGTFGEDPEVVARARELFAADHERGEQIDANLATAVLAIVVSHAGPDELEAVLERWRNPRDPMDQVRHLYALSNLSDERLAQQVRELCRSEVRSQNAPYLLAGLLRGREVGRGTWAFITEHFEELKSRFPANSIHRMLDGLALCLPDDDGAAFVTEVEAFCEEHIEAAQRRLIDQTLERLRVNLGFANRERGGLATVLAQA